MLVLPEMIGPDGEGQLAGGKTHGLGRRLLALWVEGADLVEYLPAESVAALSEPCNPGHGGYRLQRILPRCSFTAEHHCTGAVEHGIGNVAGLTDDVDKVHHRLGLLNLADDGKSPAVHRFHVSLQGTHIITAADKGKGYIIELVGKSEGYALQDNLTVFLKTTMYGALGNKSSIYASWDDNDSVVVGMKAWF